MGWLLGHGVKVGLGLGNGMGLGLGLGLGWFGIGFILSIKGPVWFITSKPQGLVL